MAPTRLNHHWSRTISAAAQPLWRGRDVGVGQPRAARLPTVGQRVGVGQPRAARLPTVGQRATPPCTEKRPAPAPSAIQTLNTPAAMSLRPRTHPPPSPGELVEQPMLDHRRDRVERCAGVEINGLDLHFPIAHPQRLSGPRRLTLSSGFASVWSTPLVAVSQASSGTRHSLYLLRIPTILSRSKAPGLPALSGVGRSAHDTGHSERQPIPRPGLELSAVQRNPGWQHGLTGACLVIGHIEDEMK
jgi:hypothetical protein